MNFTNISTSDIEMIKDYVTRKDYNSYQFSGASLYYFSGKYKAQICQDEGFLHIKHERPGIGEVFFMPIGTGDLKRAINKIIEYHNIAHTGCDLIFWGVTDEMKEDFEHAVPDVELRPDRDWAEYIYEAEKLKTLSGKALHKKRNKLNQFINAYYGRHQYEPISSQNIEEVIAFNTEIFQYYKSKLLNADGQSSDEATLEELSLIEENQFIENALIKYNKYNLIGGLLRVDSKICAFGYGTAINNKTFDYLCEKADRAFEGAFLMFQREFITNSLSSFTFINKEEDLGIIGLRHAKERLRPHTILMKYTAVLHANGTNVPRLL